MHWRCERSILEILIRRLGHGCENLPQGVRLSPAQLDSSITKEASIKAESLGDMSEAEAGRIMADQDEVTKWYKVGFAKKHVDAGCIASFLVHNLSNSKSMSWFDMSVDGSIIVACDRIMILTALPRSFFLPLFLVPLVASILLAQGCTSYSETARAASNIADSKGNRINRGLRWEISDRWMYLKVVWKVKACNECMMCSKSDHPYRVLELHVKDPWIKDSSLRKFLCSHFSSGNRCPGWYHTPSQITNCLRPRVDRSGQIWTDRS